MHKAADPPRRATMKDVAARAGVGLSTVSRVVSGKGVVSEPKVRAVRRAIRELGFSRNDFAYTLRTGSSGTIGMVVTNIADPFFSALIGAVEESARKRNQLVLVASTTDDADESVRVINRLLQRRLDGLIAVAPEGADLRFLQQEKRSGTPLVLVDQPVSAVTSDLVLADNEGGAAAATRHLVAAGHRRIACLAHAAGRYTSVRRTAGYCRGLAESGLAADPELMLVLDDRVDVCAAALRKLEHLPEPPTAIFTTNNRTTKALLQALPQVQLRYGLVGFDDFDLAGLVNPPISTIAQDPERMGKAAAEQLYRRVAGWDGPVQRLMIPTRLIERGSGELLPE